MLWTPVNEFNSQVDNFGATYTNPGLGTTITAHASAHTKGSVTQVLSALADDCYFLSVMFTRTNTTVAATGFLADIVYDPAGGTSWQTIIPNLLVHQPALSRGGYHYAFPIYMPAGSTVGCQIQGSTGGVTIQCAVRAYGKPSRPDLVNVGSKVQALGVNTGTTRGTSITPGTNAMGSYTATLGTLNFDAWWWQCGWTTTDTSIGSAGYLLDIAANATNKILCAQNVPVNADASENVGKAAFGPALPIRRISSGQDVYMRAASIGTPDSTISIAAYALGG